MRIDDTNHTDPEALALSALGWTLADEARAQRLLALTGLTPEDLRLRLAEAGLLAAVIPFLVAHEPDLLPCPEDHEPDLLAYTEALGIPPAELDETRRRIKR